MNKIKSKYKFIYEIKDDKYYKSIGAVISIGFNKINITKLFSHDKWIPYFGNYNLSTKLEIGKSESISVSTNSFMELSSSWEAAKCRWLRTSHIFGDQIVKTREWMFHASAFKRNTTPRLFYDCGETESPKSQIRLKFNSEMWKNKEYTEQSHIRNVLYSTRGVLPTGRFRCSAE
jgi:hypothetical protein